MPRKKETDMGDGGGRRKEIILAAAKLFRKQGFNGTSIVEIAREVGLPKGSIYNYVQNKEELLYETISLGIRASLPRLRAIAEADESSEDKLRRIVHENTLSMAKHSDIISIFFRDKNNLSDEHYKEYVSCRDEVEGFFKKILEQGMAEGVFRTDNVTLLAFAILGMCNWMTQWYRPDGEFSAERLATCFAEAAMHMVRP